MKTVKEVSKLTGVSVRTLHYYDEIGLLKPAQTNEAGYRFYDDKSLETLQQILYFKEFDMPLKEIKTIISSPELDKNQLLSSQKKILVLKKERLERIIASIDDILKGENKMDFEVFSQTDIQELYHSIMNNLSEEQKKIFTEEYGSLEQFKEHFIKTASSEQAQKNFAKVVEWYGSKDEAMSVVKKPHASEITKAYAKRYDSVIKKLAAKVGTDVNTFEVKEIVGELDFAAKQLYQMKDMSAFMLELAEKYINDTKLQTRLDTMYGERTTKYIGLALKAFYNHNNSLTQPEL